MIIWFQEYGEKGLAHLYAYITGVDGHVVARLWLDSKGKRWWWSEAELHAEITASMVLNWDELIEKGLTPRAWWVLWECRDCGAKPWQPCRHLKTGKPNKCCHRGRRPL